MTVPTIDFRIYYSVPKRSAVTAKLWKYDCHNSHAEVTTAQHENDAQLL